jgi:hypothetical protein
MSEMPDAVMKHAKRDKFGNVAIAHLRRHDKDVWDSLVVGEDGQPLVFWASGERPNVQELVTRNDGSFLMVAVATPPGVEPAGFLYEPADEWRSPLLIMRGLVSEEGLTLVSRAGRDPGPPRPFGPEMLRSLLGQVAMRRGEQVEMVEINTSDSGTANVLIDWDRRPLMFWTTLPDKKDMLELMAAVSVEGRTLAVAVDQMLRPILSGATLAQNLDHPGE